MRMTEKRVIYQQRLVIDQSLHPGPRSKGERQCPKASVVQTPR